MGYKVAVAGATGNVGREMLDILHERGFPADDVVALASRRSQGTEVSFGDGVLKVRTLDDYDFSDTDICLMSAGGAVSREWSPRIGRQDCVVIDNSSAWRYDADVPLIVPEVNADAITGFTRRNIIANPNCSDDQSGGGAEAAARPRLAPPAWWSPTYESASGAGKAGERRRSTQHLRELSSPIRSRAKNSRSASPSTSSPYIDTFMEDGVLTREEAKMVAETKQILDPMLKLVATCVRVPVFVSHSRRSRRIRGSDLGRPSTGASCARRPVASSSTSTRRWLRDPYQAAGEDATYITRIRKDPTVDNGSCSGSSPTIYRKGAALNAVQTAETRVNRKLIEPKRRAAFRPVAPAATRSDRSSFVPRLGRLHLLRPHRVRHRMSL